MFTVDVLKTLQDAHILLQDVRHWTQGATARNADNYPCEVLSEDARRWCLSGAVQRCAHLVVKSIYAREAAQQREMILSWAYRRLTLELPESRNGLPLWTVPTFNDIRSHPEVLHLLEQAIATMKTEMTEITP